MPKIIDHGAVREDLARKAIPLFRQYGYHGLSFRTLAKELGVSKSGLYHYFEDKDALFRACGDILLHTVVRTSKNDGASAPLESLMEMAKALHSDFTGEIRLLLDLVDNADRRAVPVEDMEMFRDRLKGEIAAIIGEEKAPIAERLIFGDLLIKALDRRRHHWDDLKDGLSRIIGAGSLKRELPGAQIPRKKTRHDR